MSIDQTIANLKYAPASVVQAADKLVSLRRNKDPWTVIDHVIAIWQSTHPTEYNSFVIDLDFDKKNGKVTNVGSKRFSNVSIDKETGGMLQKKLDIPERVIYMIRKLYTSEELPMDEDFYTKWARRYPQMVVSEVVA